jgi:hypothetical protein
VAREGTPHPGPLPSKAGEREFLRLLLGGLGRSRSEGGFQSRRGKRHLMAVDELCFKTFDPEQGGRWGSLSLRKGEGWGEGFGLGI